MRATRASNAEAQQRKLAQQAAANESAQRKQAEAVAGLLESVFQGLDPFSETEGGPDLKTHLVAQLDNTAASLAKDYAGEPLVRARLRNALGWTELRLGEVNKADVLLQSALNEQRAYVSLDDPRTLTIMNNLASAYLFTARYPDAIKLFEQVRDERTKIFGPDHLDTLTTLNSLARAYYLAGRTAEAVKLFERVRDQRIQTLGPVQWSAKAKSPDYPARLVTAELLTAMGHHRLGLNDQARAALQRAERQAEHELPHAGEGDLGVGGVENWLVYQTLHREATGLISGKMPATTRSQLAQ